MAPKRTHFTSRPSVAKPTAEDNVILPTEPTQEQNTETKTLLEKFEAMQEQIGIQNETIRSLTKKVAQANGDISEEAKDSKRKYGYELDGHTRRKDEQFEYGYRVLVNERKEKVIVKTETIGRPVTSINYNTGKRLDQHDIEITFHDGTKTEMDAIEYINQFYTKKQLVDDSDIETINGEKFYTFHTDKFWTFTISQKFIN